ncbi:MAG: GNAT family N-acetyltransferase [Elusimicrobia bacterium]|nr:GNAT family N-acetyltransferase [Elusimicrobiota bacterium]
MFREYAQGLAGMHCLDGFHAEVDGLPGAYAAPQGRLLIAKVGRRPAGCVGLRPVKEGTCELKRLYVRPAFRGKKIGRALTEKAISEAKAAGYSRMVLDTLPTMTEARALYRKLGFTPSEPYWENPTPTSICLEKSLA